MAMETISLQHFRIAFPNKDRLREILQSKSFGMPESIRSLSDPLGNEIMGKVTIHTRGHSMMACLLPGIKLRLHDVAIHARRRVPPKVRKPFSILERKGAQSQKHSERDSDHQARCRHSHSRIRHDEQTGNNVAYHSHPRAR